MVASNSLRYELRIRGFEMMDGNKFTGKCFTILREMRNRNLKDNWNSEKCFPEIKQSIKKQAIFIRNKNNEILFNMNRFTDHSES